MRDEIELTVDLERCGIRDIVEKLKGQGITCESVRRHGDLQERKREMEERKRGELDKWRQLLIIALAFTVSLALGVPVCLAPPVPRLLPDRHRATSHSAAALPSGQ